MTAQCPYCELHLDTLQAAAMHAFKSEDEQHDDAEDLDAAMQAVVAFNTDDPDGEGGAGAVDVDGDDDGPNVSEPCDECGSPTAPIEDVLDEREDEVGAPIVEEWREDLEAEHDVACPVCSSGDTVVVPS